MIQLTNQRVQIHAKLSENDNFTLQFNAHYSNQISGVFDKGYEGFRQHLSQEIFLPDNKALFVLANKEGKKYNQFESVKEGLELFYNETVVYFKLIKEKGQKDNAKLRINQLRQLIQGLDKKISLFSFDPDNEKHFKFSISDQKKLGDVEFKFLCSGKEQTLSQLKKKALDLFFQNFPKIEILVEYDYFTIRNNNLEYGINENNELVSFIFQKDSKINLELCLKGPVDAQQLQNQFGNLFYKFVSFGHDIQYVFQKFYKFVQERGQPIDSQEILSIEEKIIDTCVEELQLSDQIYQQKCDTIREFARSAVNFAKKVSKTKLAINSAPYIVGGGILGKFFSNLNFSIISSEIHKVSANSIDMVIIIDPVSHLLNQIDSISSTFGYILGAVVLASEIGYLIYHRKKFTKFMFYKRMCSAVVKAGTGILSFKVGVMAATALVAPTFLVSIIGIILGVGLAFISQYLFEKVVNYFLGSDKQIATDINFLNDHDKNKCYFSSLKDIDCDETTPTHEIKKLRLKRLKELHPDKQNDSNKNDEFIKQYVAFEIVLSFRESQAKK